MEADIGEVEGNHIPEDEPALTKGDKMAIEGQQDSHNDEDEMVEVDIYENDWYE